MTATIRYQVGISSGRIQVVCDPDDDDDTIIAKAKSQLRRSAGGSLPDGYQRFKIIERN